MKSIEECLDIILQELAKNWNKPNEERDNLKGEELLRQFELPPNMQKHEFFKRLIQRLFKDGYAETISDTYLSILDSINLFEAQTIITIEGYYFITEDKGYTKAREKRENAETLADERDKRLANGTVWLVVVTGALFLLEILIHWDDLSKLFSCHQIVSLLPTLKGLQSL
jgi:hypothetical protein